MTVVKPFNYLQEQFTIANNSAINDTRVSTKSIGAWLRIISKDKDWEISAKGMSTIYGEGEDFWRTCFKELCKYGYLVREPMRRDKGKFTKPTMILYPESQFEEPLEDELVNKLFSAKCSLSDDEIQKMLPKRIFRHGLTGTANPRQQKKEEQKKDIYKKTTTKKETPTAVVVPSFLKEIKFLTERQAKYLADNYTTEDLEKAVSYMKDYKKQIKSPKAFIEETIKGRFWENQPEDPLKARKLIDSNEEYVRTTLVQIVENKTTSDGFRMEVNNDSILFVHKKRIVDGCAEHYGFRFNQPDFIDQVIEFLKNRITEKQMNLLLKTKPKRDYKKT